MPRSLFHTRRELKPVRYPEVLPYKDAIRQSYWVHDEYQWADDVQDYHTRLTPQEQQTITRTILSIAQVEVQVKTMWRDLGSNFRTPEFDAVGVTFAESEVRHADGYSHLLDLTGTAELFARIQTDMPALADRMTYLDKYNNTSLHNNPRLYVEKLVVFSIFIEYVSLFSQFYIAKSFHKHRNLFKGLSNLVDATSKEEELHGKFGFLLVDLLRQERPDLFDSEMDDAITTTVLKAIRAEQKVLDWIFETGDLDFVSRDDALDFTLHRVHVALESCGFGHVVGERGLGIKNPAAFEWFNVELISTKHYDFFNQRPTNYSLNTHSFDAEDLF